MSDTYFVTPADAPQTEQLTGIYRRTMATTSKMMLCEFFIERERIVPQHQHPHDQVGYVVFGKLELTVAGETRVCLPGDTYQIAGGIEHGAVALVDTLVIEVFAPPREEYLPK
jgi:quercetin dioxygenase-like cupin family protein